MSILCCAAGGNRGVHENASQMSHKKRTSGVVGVEGNAHRPGLASVNCYSQLPWQLDGVLLHRFLTGNPPATEGGVDLHLPGEPWVRWPVLPLHGTRPLSTEEFRPLH